MEKTLDVNKKAIIVYQNIFFSKNLASLYLKKNCNSSYCITKTGEKWEKDSKNLSISHALNWSKLNTATNHCTVLSISICV